MMDGKRFIRRFFASEMIGAFLGAPVAVAYVLLLIRFTPGEVRTIVAAAAVMTAAVVLLMAAPTNHLLTRGLREAIDGLARGDLDSAGAERLFRRLNRLPCWHGFWIFARIAIGIFLIALYLVFRRSMPPVQIFSGFFLAVYGGYIAGLTAFMAIQHLVREPCETMVREGRIDLAAIRKRRYFGISFYRRAVIFLVIPAFYANASIFLFFYINAMADLTPDDMMARLLGVLGVNLFTLFGSIFLIVQAVHRRIEGLEQSLTVFAADSGDLTRTIPTSLSDEFDYISHQINEAIGNLRKLLRKIQSTSGGLHESTSRLSSAAQSIYTASSDQSSAVKEIVSAMTDSERRSREITEDVRSVAASAEGARSRAGDGVAIIRRNNAKMEEIKGTNAETIREVHQLNEQIKGIWEIVGIINAIASQTKIIAFNAELEAGTVSGDGRNFEIVAGEVRRLADNTVESTQEIEETMAVTQSASDRLIMASEEGTRRIEEGWAVSNELERVFETILEAAENSAASADRITAAIDRQASAFEGILQKLTGISDGIERFADSTGDANQATDSMKGIAEDLNRIVKRYVV